MIPLPDITFEDAYTLELGNRILELTYYGPNHGESLIVMRLPKEKILFIVDIVTPRRVAFRNMPDFWPDEWIRSLKEIEQMDYRHVISGHGPQNQPAINPASVVTEQRVYLEDLMMAVKTAMDSGTHSPDELRKTVKLQKKKLEILPRVDANEYRTYLGLLPYGVVIKENSIVIYFVEVI